MVVPLRSGAYLTFGIPMVASCEVILPATSMRRPIQRFTPSTESLWLAASFFCRCFLVSSSLARVPYRALASESIPS